MLQKAKGQVELKLIRSSSPVGPPADIQPINMVMDDKVCVSVCLFVCLSVCIKVEHTLFSRAKSIT